MLNMETLATHKTRRAQRLLLGHWARRVVNTKNYYRRRCTSTKGVADSLLAVTVHAGTLQWGTRGLRGGLPSRAWVQVL